MSTLDMQLDRIAAAISGNYAGTPDYAALSAELADMEPQNREHHERIDALEARIAELASRRQERRLIARRLSDQAEAAAVRVALEEIERQLTARLEARRRVTLHDVERMIHTARSALSVDRAREVQSC